LHVVDEGVNCETRAFFEHWDFYARNVEEAWNFLNWLAQDTYEFEISCANSYNPRPCIPNLAPSLCETCHCSDHDSTSYPYYISDEVFSRLSSMIEIINEQHIEIVNRMREYNLSRETDLRFSSARLDAKFCDDGASFPPLESELEEVLDPSPTTLSFVAPSSFSVSVNKDDLCYELNDFSTQVPDCHETSLESSCVDVVVVEPTTPDVIAHVSPDHVDLPHVFPLPSLPSPFLECRSLIAIDFHDALKEKVSDCMDSPGTFRGYDTSLDPYSLYRGSMPAKIMLTIVFRFFTDFSKAFDKFKRALTIISAFLFKCSYLHRSELHAQMFDKLLRALTASE